MIKSHLSVDYHGCGLRSFEALLVEEINPFLCKRGGLK
jgi:hypothetical protein